MPPASRSAEKGHVIGLAFFAPGSDPAAVADLIDRVFRHHHQSDPDQYHEPRKARRTPP